MEVALVRYGLLRQAAEFVPRGRDEPRAGSACVVHTPRGVELGHTLAVVGREAPPSGAGTYLRAATDEDEARQRELEASRAADARQAQRVVGDEARVVGAERLLDNERVVVYYTCDGRVGVPELLEGLRASFARSVSLTHVGARQRARIVGGCGPCGRTLCCASFLRRLEPVPIRLARVQGLDLDPERSAGRCGRLKCCLRYENAHYEEHLRGIPRVGWEVRSRRVSGTVLAVDVLRGRVLVAPDAGRPRAIFAEEVERAGPPRRAPLPRADAPPPLISAAPPAEPPPEQSWSQMAWRLWRRWRDRDEERPED
ncbi:MAG: regulatory iron-sulfur-containing complex subunit RicT [Planctomycetota bacterium]